MMTLDRLIEIMQNHAKDGFGSKDVFFLSSDGQIIRLVAVQNVLSTPYFGGNLGDELREHHTRLVFKAQPTAP